jgi:Ca2+-binding RTX toxin-like protein
MPIISTDQMTTAPVTLVDQDPFLYLKADTLFWLTSPDLNAFRTQTTVQAFIHIDGTLRAQRSAISVISSIGPRVTVGKDGLVEGQVSAFNTFNVGAASFITNHGVMSSVSGPAINAGNENNSIIGDRIALTNTGTISSESGVAFRGGAGADIIRNSGTMMGNIDLGGGSNVYDGRGGHLHGEIFSGTGSDRYFVDGQIDITDTGGFDLVQSYGDFVLPRGIEVLNLQGAAINGRGNDGDNFLNGNLLDNVLRGGKGADTIDGGDGNDRLFGEAGNDSITGGAGADVMDGGGGTDTVSWAGSDAGVVVNIATNVLTGGFAEGDSITGFEIYRGSSLDDRIFGSDRAETIFGSEGADILSGGGGNDVLEGGRGADKIDGGAGIDTITFDLSSNAVTVNLTTGVGTGGEAEGDTYTGIENVVGTDFNDVIVGSNANNVLNGGHSDDKLFGGGGNDRLIGGLFDDILTGGAGADLFVFANIDGVASTLGDDRIMDFEDGVDRIDFRGNTLVNSMADLSFSISGQHTLITTTVGDTILLVGVPLASITASDFLFD